MNVKCLVCKKEFKKKSRKQKYCSKECYWESKVGKSSWSKGKTYLSDLRIARPWLNKKRPNMIGNTFGFQKGHIPWNKNEKGCVTKKRKGVPYFCDNCGKKIMRIPWQIKFGWGKFCSLICKQQSKELKNRISRLAKLRWQDPEFFKKSFKAFSRRPTSLEKQMMEIIRKYNLPYKYTGDGSFLIGWKNPDFVNTNSEKKVIEVGNIYHHPYPYAENRAKHYAKYGWASYIFIQDKLNEEEIINKLAI